jgi:hypothetical protein
MMTDPKLADQAARARAAGEPLLATRAWDRVAEIAEDLALAVTERDPEAVLSLAEAATANIRQIQKVIAGHG